MLSPTGEAVDDAMTGAGTLLLYFYFQGEKGYKAGISVSPLDPWLTVISNIFRFHIRTGDKSRWGSAGERAVVWDAVDLHKSPGHYYEHDSKLDLVKSSCCPRKVARRPYSQYLFLLRLTFLLSRCFIAVTHYSAAIKTLASLAFLHFSRPFLFTSLQFARYRYI